MVRVILLRLWLAALPFGVWFLWRAWSRHTGREMGSTPWGWLAGLGGALLAGSLILGVLFRPGHGDEVYVPAEEQAGGSLASGHYAPKGGGG